jgi:hypothetical protein
MPMSPEKRERSTTYGDNRDAAKEAGGPPPKAHLNEAEVNLILRASPLKTACPSRPLLKMDFMFDRAAGIRRRSPEGWLRCSRVVGQTSPADQLLWASEPADVADRRNDAGCDREIHARDRHQSFYCGIVDCELCYLAIKVLHQPVKFTHVPIDGASLVVRQWLPRQPRLTAAIDRSACGHFGIRWACSIE